MASYPYVIEHGIPGLKFEVSNNEAKDWYDPLKPYTLLEYQWVKENVPIAEDTFVIDAGCHHGNYSILFKPAYVLAIDINLSSISYAKRNMDMNGVRYDTACMELGKQGIPSGLPLPDIYKCDIEGSEYSLFPEEMRRFPSIHTWIIEFHPNKGDPDSIVAHFVYEGYLPVTVDRDWMKVRPYKMGEGWSTQRTVIFQRRQHV